MKIFKLAFILALITGLSGLSLSYINDITTPVIAEGLLAKETKLYQEMFVDMDHFEKQTVDHEAVDYVATIYNQQNDVLGYVHSVTGINGYGTITALVGIDPDGNIVSLKYSVFNQTPGFGDKLKTPNYLSQFKKMSVDQIAIDGVSGATFSSTLVDKLVNDAATYYRQGGTK